MVILEEKEKYIRLGLSTIGQARASFGRIVRAYFRDQIDEVKFRALCSGFTTLGNLFKQELAQELETRIEQLERRLSDESNRKAS